MKKLLFVCSILLCNIVCGQVAVNLPTGQPIDPLAAFQVCGTVRIDSLPLSVTPTDVILLDGTDTILHKMSLTSFISLLYQSLPAIVPVTHVYTTDTTWTKPPGLKYIVVEMVGGGGGGGGCYNYAGGAGAGSGYTRKIISSPDLGTVEIIMVGIGGIGGAPQSNGNTGGTSSFGIHCSATGGQGGIGQNSVIYSSVGSNPGKGIGGDINISGQGTGGAVGSAQPPYTGGSSYFGGGSPANPSTSGSADGINANSYGSGGSGGVGNGSVNRIGGNGSSGVVIVTEYY